MKLKLDVKTLVIGIAIGVAVTAVIGAKNSDQADMIAIPSYSGEGAALVRTADDSLFVISTKNGMAFRVLQAGAAAELNDHRSTARGKPFSMTAPSQPTKGAAGQGY